MSHSILNREKSTAKAEGREMALDSGRNTSGKKLQFLPSRIDNTIITIILPGAIRILEIN